MINENLSKSHSDAEQDALLAACRLVANFGSIPITAPKGPKSEDYPPVTLNDILRSSHFRDRKVKLTGNWWEKDNGPLLVFKKEGNYPVALIPKSPTRYENISPGESIRQFLTAKEASELAPEAHQFYCPFPDAPLNGVNLMRFALKGSMRDVLFILFAGMVGGGLTILVPIFTGNIFDKVIPQSDYRQLCAYSIVIFFSIVAIAFFQLIRSFSMIRIETKPDFALQSALWDRLLNLPAPFFRKYQAGELDAKANSIMMLRKILSETVVFSLLGAIFLMFNFFLMFYYDVSLSFYILFHYSFLVSGFFHRKKITTPSENHY